jgi:hypothetical protein
MEPGHLGAATLHVVLALRGAALVVNDARYGFSMTLMARSSFLSKIA